jgi:hypothetical protein
MTSTEAAANTVIFSPQDVRSKSVGNLPVQSLKSKRLSLDTLLKITSSGVTLLIANKADISYVNTQIATRATPAYVVTLASPKMDSVRANVLFSLKADITALASKVDVSTFNTSLSTKANLTDISAKDNIVDVNAKLGFKANVASPTFSGDVELGTLNSGVIIKSPNGTRFRLTISNSGDIIATSL